MRISQIRVFARFSGFLQKNAFLYSCQLSETIPSLVENRNMTRIELNKKRK